MESHQHRYIELDSLRGLAALTVVLGHFLNVYRGSHWQIVFDSSPLRVVAAAHEAVILFFLLSGFVLAVPLSKPTPPSYLEFLVKRLCRIWLPYVAALAIAATGSWFLFSTVPTGNSWIDQTWSQRPTLRLLLQHLLMIGHYPSAQLNTAFWSLIYEMRISLVYPLLYSISKRTAVWLMLPTAFVLSIAAAIYADKRGSEGFCYNILYAAFFVVGIYLYRHLAAISLWFRTRGENTRRALIVLAVLCFDGPGAFPEIVVYGSRFVPLYLREWITLCGAVGILLFSIELLHFRHFLHHAAIRHLGAISYSVYLVHATVLFALIRLNYSRMNHLVLLWIYLVLTYLVAELLHFLVERPSIRAGRALGRIISTSILNR